MDSLIEIALFIWFFGTFFGLLDIANKLQRICKLLEQVDNRIWAQNRDF